LGGIELGETMPEEEQILEERRRQIGEEITGITTMMRGTFNEFYCPEQKLKDGSVVKHGPFYNITTKGVGGKTISKSVKKGDVARMRHEVESYCRFRKLAGEYVEVCEQLSEKAAERAKG
jgi:hypothetical protein